MKPRSVRVWDLPVRLLHALLVLGVAAAWWTAGDARRLDLHVAAGSLVAVVLVLRLLWGFVGTEHARWRAFLFSPAAVLRHLRSLLRGDAPRFLGHNPVASAAMLVGLLILVALSVTGVLVLGGEEGLGLLAGRVDTATGIALHAPHEVLAWALLGFVGLHLAGVLKESLRTRENLPLSMVHGRKRPEPGVRSVRSHRGVAVAGLLGLALACAGPLTPEAPAPAPGLSELARDAQYEQECGDCHLAFHPSLLPVRSWDLLMARQADHFGEDLMLDPALAGRLQDFLVRHAAELSDSEAAWRVAHDTPVASSPLRVTQTPMWVQAHAGLSDETFQAEPVRSALRCEACHEDALGGRFANRAIHLPEPPSTSATEPL